MFYLVHNRTDQWDVLEIFFKKKKFPVGTFYCGQRKMIKAFLLSAMIKIVFASVPWQWFLKELATCIYWYISLLTVRFNSLFFAEWLLMLVVLSSVWLCIFLLVFTCYLPDSGGFRTKTSKLAWECFSIHPAVVVFQSGSVSLSPFESSVSHAPLILLCHCPHCCYKV